MWEDAGLSTTYALALPDVDTNVSAFRALLRVTNDAGDITEAVSNALSVDHDMPVLSDVSVSGFNADDGLSEPCVLRRAAEILISWAGSDASSGLKAQQVCLIAETSSATAD